MTVFIVEDHPVMRSMLQEFIESLPQMEVAGSAGSAEEALAKLPNLSADLLLVDVSLPGMSGIDFVRTVSSLYPDLPCLMLTGHQQSNYVDQALAAGAIGYVIKGDPINLYDVLGRARSGEKYLSASVTLAAER